MLPLSHSHSENDSAGLDWAYFTGKAVYIDLQRKLRQLEANLKASLKKAGATTEYFFSKDVDCIITDRVVKSYSCTCSSSKTSTTNPGTSNILLAAKKLRIPIVHLCNLPQTLPDRLHPTHPPLSGKIYQLKPPFFKCEDLSRRYRPLVYQWNAHKRSFAKNRKVASRGYCENCHTHFTDLQAHLASAKHRSYAENENNFKGIDECIAAGTSLEEFVAGIRKKYAVCESDSS